MKSIEITQKIKKDMKELVPAINDTKNLENIIIVYLVYSQNATINNKKVSKNNIYFEFTMNKVEYQLDINYQINIYRCKKTNQVKERFINPKIKLNKYKYSIA